MQEFWVIQYEHLYLNMVASSDKERASWTVDKSVALFFGTYEEAKDYGISYFGDTIGWTVEPAFADFEKDLVV